MKKAKQVEDVIASAISYISRLKKNKFMLIQPLQEEDYEKALSATKDLIEGLQWLNEVLILTINSFNVKLSEIEAGDISIEQEINDFNTFLTDVMEALENRDFVFLQDLYEYELEANLSRYDSIFTFLYNHISK